jgi:hypothetical protein
MSIAPGLRKAGRQAGKQGNTGLTPQEGNPQGRPQHSKRGTPNEHCTRPKEGGQAGGRAAHAGRRCLQARQHGLDAPRGEPPRNAPALKEGNPQ